jgi:tetratricopeptide (TPR) repeat protein
VKLLKKLFLIIIFFTNITFLYTQELESQPNVIFQNKYIKKKSKNIQIRINFNNAVLYLEQEKYIKAINIFKQTAKKIKIPSFLNIGIAYYKLKSFNNSYLYLKKLYDLKQLYKQDLYSYVSASYYLYQITNDRKYITSILKVIKNTQRQKIDESVKLLVVNTYIILKEYKKAIKVIRSLKEFNNFKLALLYIKAKDYSRSELYLQKALNNENDDEIINKLLWFQMFVALKTNNIGKIKSYIDKIDERLDIFKRYTRMPIKIFFNKNKYTSKQLFANINKFDINRKINILFYFAPFIFSDNQQIKLDSTFAFVLKDENKITSLSKMLEYNNIFIKIVKLDPILRVQKLQKMIDAKMNIYSYEYFNLALSYAHIYNYKKAYFYFNKAYILNKANKLYSSLTLVSAKKADIKIPQKDFSIIKENLQSQNGTNKYIGKYIYKIIFNNNYKLNNTYLNENTRNTTFFRALEFLEYYNDKDINKHDILLYKDIKDPLVFLFRTMMINKHENKYEYISRLQDYIPKNFNDYFIKGPLIITEYYIDILKALAIFDKSDFKITGDTTPTYQRTKALIDLYDGYSTLSIKSIEALQKRYKLYDRSTYNLLIASYLSANDYSNASATLSILQFELDDNDAKFLIALQLLNELKLSSANILFKKKYTGSLVDFKLEGLDEFLENL